MTSILQPTVNLDSEAIRRIREEKKLTQLYVAKVVGVTTDTVSRWENNRYPSIKRENAVRLAEALEVDVEEILEKNEDDVEGVDEEAEPAEAFPPQRSKDSRAWLLLLPALLVVAGVIIYWLMQRQDTLVGRFEGYRSLPPYAAPGEVIPVHIRLETDDTVKGYILRESFPKGWQLVEAAPPPTSLNNAEGVARWIVKPGDERNRVVYRLRVGENVGKIPSTAYFSGEIIVNPNGRNLSVSLDGDAVVEVDHVQWADLNGDGIVDDGEMLEASDTVDAMKGVHMDWDALEAIWDAGGYRWDEDDRVFVPHKPPAVEEPAPLENSQP